MVNQTTKWIEGGGKPKFITDWKNFLKDAGDVAIGDVIRETDLAPICSPFKVQLQLALQPSRPYREQITCSLSEVVDNIEAFYNDFSKGGWVAYNQVWGSNNNFYGTYLMAANEMANRSAKAQDAAKTETQANAGFLSVTQKGECLEFETLAPDVMGPPKCIKYAPDEIINPGKSVGDIAANALGAEGQWATNISSWTSVLINALINRVTKEGVDFAGKTISKIVSGGGSGETASTADNFQNLIDQKTSGENQRYDNRTSKIY